MTRKVCSIADCSDLVVGRGWCHFHYYRWKRWGDPEAAGKTCLCANCGETWIRTAKGGRPDYLCPTCRETHARCSVCEGIFELSSFFIGRNGRAGSRCKTCSSEYTTTRYAGLPDRTERNRKARLKRLYGMSPEEYQQMNATQGGKCAICLDEAEKLVVDHCHSQGGVRALLCSNCNTGLGMFRDEPLRLAAAIEYLHMHREP